MRRKNVTKDTYLIKTGPNQLAQYKTEVKITGAEGFNA